MRITFLLVVASIFITKFSYGQFPLGLGFDFSGGIHSGIGEPYNRNVNLISTGIFVPRDYIRPFGKIGVVAFTPPDNRIQANLRLSYTRYISKTETIYAPGETGFFLRDSIEGTFVRSFDLYLFDYNLHLKPGDNEFFSVFYGFGIGFFREKTITNFDPPANFIFSNSYDDLGSNNEVSNVGFAFIINAGAQYEFEHFRIYSELSIGKSGLNIGVGTVIPFIIPS